MRHVTLQVLMRDLVFWKRFIKVICKGLNVIGDDMRVECHWCYALRCCFLFLVDTFMFMDKSAVYVDMVYLKYFTDLSVIHEYN